jgi:hypothetical protein
VTRNTSTATKEITIMTTTTAAPAFATFTPPPPKEAGDKFGAQANVNKPLILKVTEKKFIAKTQFKPEGGDAIFLDLVDLTNGEVFRQIMWMNGALVDQLSEYVGGQPLVVRLVDVPKKSGTGTYVGLQQGTDADIAAATKFYGSHGDPFAQTFAQVKSTVVPPNQGTKPPF